MLTEGQRVCKFSAAHSMSWRLLCHHQNHRLLDLNVKSTRISSSFNFYSGRCRQGRRLVICSTSVHRMSLLFHCRTPVSIPSTPPSTKTSSRPPQLHAIPYHPTSHPISRRKGLIQQTHCPKCSESLSPPALSSPKWPMSHQTNSPSPSQQAPPSTTSVCSCTPTTFSRPTPPRVSTCNFPANQDLSFWAPSAMRSPQPCSA